MKIKIKVGDKLRRVTPIFLRNSEGLFLSRFDKLEDFTVTELSNSTVYFGQGESRTFVAAYNIIDATEPVNAPLEGGYIAYYSGNAAIVGLNIIDPNDWFDVLDKISTVENAADIYTFKRGLTLDQYYRIAQHAIKLKEMHQERTLDKRKGTELKLDYRLVSDATAATIESLFKAYYEKVVNEDSQ